MRQIVDGVFEVDIAHFVHAHLVVIDGGVALVDTGIPSRECGHEAESVGA